MTGSRQLPPGQWIAPLERFGLPEFAPRKVVPPARAVVTVSGHVRHAAQFEIAGLLAGLPRHEQISDINCVTTWSAPGLSWSGVRLRDVLERLAEQVEPRPDARWLRLTGLDGYWTCLRIDDATAEEVLLADRLAGEPLPPAHGAPVRVVAPAHYGYKSVKHLVGIDFLRRYAAGPAGWKGHPRGRVAEEERSRLLPGAVWRRVWRSTLPFLRRAYRRND
ncbi:MAG: molybdopterin-dependent oxidoreductase [Mycobacteriales bacterium]